MTTNNGHSRNGLLTGLILPDQRLDDDAYSPLLLRLDCYGDYIIGQQFAKGKPTKIGFYDPLAVATAMAGLPLSTPVLPICCLFWQQIGGVERLAVYVEPRVWVVSVALAGANDDSKRKRGKRQVWKVPLPGLVFAGYETSYQVYAVEERPASDTARLYAAPCPNVSGGICAGSAKFPTAGAGTIWKAVDLFFESDFNNHLANGKCKSHKGSVLDMWQELHEAGATAWPAGELVETRLTLADLMKQEG